MTRYDDAPFSRLMDKPFHLWYEAIRDLKESHFLSSPLLRGGRGCVKSHPHGVLKVDDCHTPLPLSRGELRASLRLSQMADNGLHLRTEEGMPTGIVMHGFQFGH